MALGPRARIALVALGLAAGVFAIYGQAVRFDFAQADDLLYVAGNDAVKAGLSPRGVAWAFTTREAANWHPLTWLSLMLDAELFGPGPAAFHASNVALHALAACLLFAGLHAATGRLGAAAGAASLLALHPIHVESVAWISGRKDLLAGVCGFAALWAYAVYARRGGLSRYLLVLSLFALGLLAKPALVTWPCVLLLLDVWPLARWRRGAGGGPVPGVALPPAPARSVRFLLLEKLPLLALSAASCVVTLQAQQVPRFVALRIGPGDRVANALVAYARYLGKLVWPDDFAFFYPHPALPGGTPLTPVALVLAPALLVGGTLLAWRQAARQPWLLVGGLWFVGVLVPMIGLVQVGRQALADRYAYLSFAGLYLALAWSVDAGLRAWHPRSAWRRDAAVAGALALFVALGLRAWLQVGTWRDAETVFAQALAVSPDAPYALSGLAAVQVQTGRIPAAEALLRRALTSDPDDIGALVNMGVVQLAQGRLDDAIRLATRVVQLDPSVPHHIQLGKFLQAAGRSADAEAHYREAIALFPDGAEARLLLARLLDARGLREQADAQRAAALAYHARALERSFAPARTLLQLGEIELERGRAADAQRHFETALEQEPGNEAARRGLAAAREAIEARSR